MTKPNEVVAFHITHVESGDILLSTRSLRLWVDITEDSEPPKGHEYIAELKSGDMLVLTDSWIDLFRDGKPHQLDALTGIERVELTPCEAGSGFRADVIME